MNMNVKMNMNINKRLYECTAMCVHTHSKYMI